MQAIDLNHKKMHVVETAQNGVVNDQTIFAFQQKGDRVFARYAGGGVSRGYLIGVMQQSALNFNYLQEHADGTLAGGSSHCVCELLPDNTVQIKEYFEWEQGQGMNVFAEID